MSEKETKLAQKESAELAVPAINLAMYAGQGNENIDQDSVAIPFIKLLQALSPEIEGHDYAKAGMFLNTVTGDAFKSVFMIPCFYNRNYVRWSPRSTGKGFQGQYNPVEIETGMTAGVQKFEQNNHPVYLFDVPPGATPFDDKGKPLYDEARDTRNHFVLVSKDGVSFAPAIFPLSSTGIKHSKRWNSKTSNIEIEVSGKKINPPSFAYIYEITSKMIEKAGNKWYEPEIKLHKAVEDPFVFNKATEFYKSCAQGMVNATPVDVDDSASSSGDGADQPF